MSEDNAIVRGRCHVFGHDLGMDTDVMPHKYSKIYPFDGGKLKAHLFEEVRPGFHEQVEPGDIIVAGRNFAKGKPHPQGLIAIAELGLSVLCESMPFYAFRGAISRGILIHRGCEGISALVEDGDTIRYDFRTGEFANEARGTTAQFAPLPGRLLDMILIGGMKPMLAEWAKQNSA